MRLQNAAAHQATGSSSNKPNRYTIVVDTSILVSAFFFGGPARVALMHVAHSHRMIVSDYIIDEFLDFAKNTLPKTPQRTLRLMRQTLEKYAEAEADSAHSVQIRDVNDIAVMRLAIEHNAAILTSDKDILEHSMGAVPPVLSVGEYEVLFL